MKISQAFFLKNLPNTDLLISRYLNGHWNIINQNLENRSKGVSEEGVTKPWLRFGLHNQFKMHVCQLYKLS